MNNATMIKDLIHEKRVTKWHNPTNAEVVAIIIEDGVKFAFRVPPGETRDLDSKYDRAMQMIDCGKDECHGRGWWCTAGHDGVISGGLGMALRRVGKKDTILPAYDPEVQEKKMLEAQMAQSATVSAAQQHALLQAAARLAEVNAAAATPATPAPAPAPAAQGDTRKK